MGRELTQLSLLFAGVHLKPTHMQEGGRRISKLFSIVLIQEKPWRETELIQALRASAEVFALQLLMSQVWWNRSYVSLCYWGLRSQWQVCPDAIGRFNAAHWTRQGKGSGVLWYLKSSLKCPDSFLPKFLQETTSKGFSVGELNTISRNTHPRTTQSRPTKWGPVRISTFYKLFGWIRFTPEKSLRLTALYLGPCFCKW